MAYGLDVTEGMARADKYLKLFRLDEKLDWFPTQFSKGDEAEGHDYLCLYCESKSFHC